MPCIYKLTSPSGKSYIGQTKFKFNARWVNHKSDFRLNKFSCPILHRAIKKYGHTSFKTEVLLECDENMLNIYEIKMIRAYNTLHPNGYNMAKGGYNGMTVASNAKRALTHKRRKNKKCNLPMYVRKLNNVHYAIISHPSCPYKQFTYYDDPEGNKIEALVYLSALNDGKTFTKHKVHNLPKGMYYDRIHRGYKIDFSVKKKRTCKSFCNPKLPLETLLHDALEFYNSVRNKI